MLWNIVASSFISKDEESSFFCANKLKHSGFREKFQNKKMIKRSTFRYIVFKKSQLRKIISILGGSTMMGAAWVCACGLKE